MVSASGLGRAAALIVSIALAFPATAHGQDPVVRVDAQVDVNALYEQGKGRFDAGDHQGAIALWAQAYDQAPATPAGRIFRVSLAPHVALAHERIYQATGDATHLRQALRMLHWYVDEYRALYQPTPENRAHLGQVIARIEQLEGQAELRQAPPPRPLSWKHAAKAELRRDPNLWGEYASGRGLTIGGGIMMGLGAGMLYATAILAASIDLDGDRGGPAPVTPIVTGISGGILLAGGMTMLIVGVSRKKRAWGEARRRVTLAPELGPTMAGLRIAGRF